MKRDPDSVIPLRTGPGHLCPPPDGEESISAATLRFDNRVAAATPAGPTAASSRSTRRPGSTSCVITSSRMRHVINPASSRVRSAEASRRASDALYEHAGTASEGTFLSSTFLDYLVPTARDIPRSGSRTSNPPQSRGQLPWCGRGRRHRVPPPSSTPSPMPSAARASSSCPSPRTVSWR